MRRMVVELWTMPDELMLVIAHASGVVYQNQVGGNNCWQAELEGVLAPLDVAANAFEAIMKLLEPYGRMGITDVTADELDAILVSEPGTKSLRVDRVRLAESWEAWVHVVADSATSPDPEEGFDSWHGFGQVRGVLTWPNSD